MKILITGFAKSGNFWLYRILKEFFIALDITLDSYIQQQPIHSIAQNWPLSNVDQANLDFIDITPNGCFYRISSIFRMPIDDIDQYISQCSLVRTHSGYCQQSPRIFNKFDRTIYLIRDPRDVLISFSNYAFTPYYRKFYPHSYKDSKQYVEEKLEATMLRWVQNVSGHLAVLNTTNLFPVFYERLKDEFNLEVRELTQALGYHLDDKQISQIQERTSVQRMRLSNPGHVRSGQAGGWKNNLTDRQKIRAAFCTRPLLDLLGFPVRNKGELKNGLPRVDSNMNPSRYSSAAKLCYLRIGLSALWNHQLSRDRLGKFFLST